MLIAIPPLSHWLLPPSALSRHWLISLSLSMLNTPSSLSPPATRCAATDWYASSDTIVIYCWLITDAAAGHRLMAAACVNIFTIVTSSIAVEYARWLLQLVTPLASLPFSPRRRARWCLPLIWLRDSLRYFIGQCWLPPLSRRITLINNTIVFPFTLTLGAAGLRLSPLPLINEGWLHTPPPPSPALADYAIDYVICRHAIGRFFIRAVSLVAILPTSCHFADCRLILFDGDTPLITDCRRWRSRHWLLPDAADYYLRHCRHVTPLSFSPLQYYAASPPSLSHYADYFAASSLMLIFITLPSPLVTFAAIASWDTSLNIITPFVSHCLRHATLTCRHFTPLDIMPITFRRCRHFTPIFLLPPAIAIPPHHAIISLAAAYHHFSAAADISPLALAMSVINVINVSSWSITIRSFFITSIISHQWITIIVIRISRRIITSNDNNNE